MLIDVRATLGSKRGSRWLFQIQNPKIEFDDDGLTELTTRARVCFGSRLGSRRLAVWLIGSFVRLPDSRPTAA